MGNAQSPQFIAGCEQMCGLEMSFFVFEHETQPGQLKQKLPVLGRDSALKYAVQLDACAEFKRHG